MAGIAGLLLLLALPLLPAAGAWGDTSRFHYFDGQEANPYRNWMHLSVLAIAICVLANTFLYVGGRVLGLPELERLAASEFFQVTASAMMIFSATVLILGAFGALQSTGVLPMGSTTLCAGRSTDVWAEGPFEPMRCRIQEKIAYVEALYSQASAINAEAEVKASYCYYVFGVPVWCNDWDPSIHAKVEQAHYLVHKMVPLGISLNGQYLFVEYIARNMLAVFLPLGLVLRIFPVLRGVGALLVAIALGFYFVFPFAYLLLDPATSRPDPAAMMPAGPRTANACYKTFSGVVSALTNLQRAGEPDGPAPDASALGAELGRLQVEAFFNPLAAFAVTLVFISAITPLLGGESGELLRFVAKVI